jgi:hypothetical protein
MSKEEFRILIAVSVVMVTLVILFTAVVGCNVTVSGG